MQPSHAASTAADTFDPPGPDERRPPSRSVWPRVRSALASRRLGCWAASVALLATAGALRNGWIFDDHFHRVLLLGLPLPGLPALEDANPFTFVTGDVETTRRAMDGGWLPWWTLETLRWSFWRPLASATHRLDYYLWPDSAPAMHAHSLLWFALLVVVVARCYRRFLGPTWIAGLATLLYALDDARAVPAVWIASRNSLIASVFCVLSLWAHDRWRRDRWQPGALLAPLAFALSLLAAEMGLSTLAYLAAYALFLDRGPGRATSLLGHAGVGAVWLYLFQAGGHGLAGSGVYTSAFSEPLSFLSELVLRFPILLLEQLGPTVALYYDVASPGERIGFAWAGLVAWVAAGLALAPLFREDPVARFWALGCVLSLVPATSATPDSRMLMLSGLGAMGLFAQLIALAFTNSARALPRWQRLVVRGQAALLVVFHAVIGPTALTRAAWANALGFEQGYARTLLLADMPSLPLEGDIAQKTVVLVNPPFVSQTLMVPLLRLVNDLSMPRHFRILAPGFRDVRVERPDASTLVLTPVGGFMKYPLGTLFRGIAHPMRTGQSVELSGMSATVLALEQNGTPSAVRFRFDRPLEQGDFIWIASIAGRLVPFTLPEVGQHATLPGVVSTIHPNR